MSSLLSIGSRGQEVRAVQDCLNYHVQRGGPLNVDGIFGPLTGARVRDFQQSNSLKADGIVGPNTRAKLFEVAQADAVLCIMPRLKLTLPGAPAGTPFQLPPPQLVGPLQINLPGFGPLPVPIGADPIPASLLPGPSFHLYQSSSSSLPPLQGPYYVFRFKATAPNRNDPIDPYVRSYQNVVTLIQDANLGKLSQDFLISLVPKPVTVFTPPSGGFNWGVSPLFNSLDPVSFGAKANASFAFQLSNGANGLPSIVLKVRADTSFSLDFGSRFGKTLPRIDLDGKIFVSAGGTF